MKKDRKTLIRHFLIELAIYGVLIVIYLFVVLRTLSGTLAGLAEDQRAVYAVASLGLIVAQGLLLEVLTSFLMDRLGLG